MKRKMVLAAMLCMLVPFTAMAGEVEVDDSVEVAQPSETEAEEAVITWSEEAEDSFVEAGFDGTFYDINMLGLKLLVPEGMEMRDPTEEEQGTGTILVFENADQGEKIEFALGPIGDCQNLDEVKDFMAVTFPGIVVTPTKLNEYDTLIFGNEQTDSMTILIGAGDSGFLRIISRPVTDPEMNKLFSFVAASVQQIKE